MPTLRKGDMHCVQETHQEAKHCLTTIPTSNQIIYARWQDKIPKVEILWKVNILSVEAITKAQLKCVGHVCRMDDSRLLKVVWYGKLNEGKYSIYVMKTSLSVVLQLPESMQKTGKP